MEIASGAQNDLRLIVRTELQDPTGERPNRAAYAFDSAGALLAQSPLGEQGEAALSLPSNTAGRAASAEPALSLMEHNELSRADTLPVPRTGEGAGGEGFIALTGAGSAPSGGSRSSPRERI
jgi:hypothetical protein